MSTTTDDRQRSILDAVDARKNLATVRAGAGLPPLREIERTYEVSLIPLDGPADGVGLPYDPVRIRLRYPEADAHELDGRSERAMTEAVERAVRLERRQFITAADTMFAGEARLVRESLVDYLPRRPRPRSAR